MRIRLIGGIAAVVIALGALAFPSAGPAQAGSAKCTGWTSTLVPPTSIRVYRTATRRTQTVRFRTYVEKVMAAEWGPTAPAAALRLGAVAVKQYAWYFAIYWRGGRDAAGHCYDVVDSTRDQVYNPSRTPSPAQRAAVAATWRVSLRKSDRLFMTGYRAGSANCTAASAVGRLYQRSAVTCVHRYRELEEALARRFYGTVSWVTPGIGDYTGDGRGDLALVTVDPETGATTAQVNTSDAAYRTAVAAANLTGTTLTSVAPDQLLGRGAGDVDGDGHADLVQLVRTDNGGVALEVMRGTSAGILPAKGWWTDAAAPLGAGTYRLVLADFTGDGRTDAGIVRIRAGATPSTSLYVVASRGTSLGDMQRTWTAPADLTTSRFLAGDMNGDGAADLVILSPAASGGTTLRVGLASRSHQIGALTTRAVDPLPLDAIRTLVADVTRDGRDDLVVVRRDGENGLRVVVYRSTAATTSFSRRYFTKPLALSFAGTTFSTADLDGDGRADLIGVVDRGLDPDGNPLGLDVVRLMSTGATFTQRPWFGSATLRWDATLPY